MGTDEHARSLERMVIPLQRWRELMANDDLELSPEELAAGWHWCNEFDGLLIGPGMDEEQHCTCFGGMGWERYNRKALPSGGRKGEKPPTPDELGCSPVSRLEHRNGRDYLRFQPHGYEFPILLPVITHGSRDAANAWTWNGSVEKPTLKPSVKTTHADGKVSHIWLTDGLCQHLGDSTDGLAGQTLPLVHLANGEAVRLPKGDVQCHLLERPSCVRHESAPNQALVRTAAHGLSAHCMWRTGDWRWAGW